MSTIRVAVYQARTATSKKSGNEYVYQQIEIQQSPERPNAQFRRFAKSIAEALEPGLYDCKVSFYVKNYELVPSFSDFVKV
jgi:hypothetical protein